LWESPSKNNALHLLQNLQLPCVRGPSAILKLSCTRVLPLVWAPPDAQRPLLSRTPSKKIVRHLAHEAHPFWLSMARLDIGQRLAAVSAQTEVSNSRRTYDFEPKAFVSRSSVMALAPLYHRTMAACVLQYSRLRRLIVTDVTVRRGAMR
jgi:hypothetical protein